MSAFPQVAFGLHANGYHESCFEPDESVSWEIQYPKMIYDFIQLAMGVSQLMIYRKHQQYFVFMAGCG